MKKLNTYNLSHSALAENLDKIIERARNGLIKEEDIKFERYDDSCSYGVRTPVSQQAAGYNKHEYNEALEDYLRLMVLCGFRTPHDLYAQVKADHEDEEGNLKVDAFYTNDPNEEGEVIATVLADTTVEDKFGKPIETIFQFGGKANRAIEDAIIRQVNRKENLVEAVHDSLVNDIREGDSTALEELLKFLPIQNLIASLPEEQQRNHFIKSSV